MVKADGKKSGKNGKKMALESNRPGMDIHFCHLLTI